MTGLYSLLSPTFEDGVLQAVSEINLLL